MYKNTAELLLHIEGKSIIEIQQQIKQLYGVAYILGSLFIISHVVFFIYFFKKLILQKQTEEVGFMTDDFLTK